MKQRTNTYLGTFVNSPEGISSYKLMVKHIRQVIRGGRFIKMFRGNKRSFMVVNNVRTGKPWKWYSGCSRKDGATHFDVYLIGRRIEDGRYVEPTFYNFKLV